MGPCDKVQYNTPKCTIRHFTQQNPINASVCTVKLHVYLSLKIISFIIYNSSSFSISPLKLETPAQL